MAPRPHSDVRIIPLDLVPSTTTSLGRQAVTCKYRCGDACSHEVPNRTSNEYFGDIVAQAISRRGLLRAGAVVAVVAGGGLGFAGTAAAGPAAESAPRPRQAGTGRPLTFQPVAPNTIDDVVVPRGYEQAVVVRWGDPIIPGAPEFDQRRQTPQSQAGQFGYNCDFLALLPMGNDPNRALLVANHEYTSEPFMFFGYDAENPTRRQVETAWQAHGMSVLLVQRDPASGRLTPILNGINRRLTATTPMELTGPAAGSELTRTSRDPGGRIVLGTLNNCAGGVTPWSTILTGEENFDQYFGNAEQLPAGPDKDALARYGIAGGATDRQWERFDRRFDAAREPNEANRFGWVMEFDPFDNRFVPRKRTALGRFKHEGANIFVAPDRTVAAYMGDDQVFEYLYKFVSSRKMRPGSGRVAKAHNLGILDEGTLYVAKLTGDSPPAEIDGTGTLPADGAFGGTGTWIPLATSNADGTGVSHVEGMTVQEVLVRTRLAGDAVGATKMDRPEDVEPSPLTGRIYAALTNNSGRGVDGAAPADEANPRNANRNGQVLEITEDGDDPTSTTFTWTLMLVCGDPNDPSSYFAGFPKDQVSPISCPDNVAFDPTGNLWISTDGNALGSNDGLFAVPVDGDSRGHVQQFLTVPRGAETCGPVIEDRLVLVAVQHPGEVDGASADAPASNWPDRGTAPPRPSVVSVWKTGRNRPGLIGS